MKKTLIISVIALAFSITSLNATTVDHSDSVSIYELNAMLKPNPFCMSIVKGDFETVKKLITLGADVNEESNGMTPVMYAAKFNKVAILELLIKKGANLKAKSSKGMTAIKYAELSNAIAAKTLIENELKKK